MKETGNKITKPIAFQLSALCVVFILVLKVLMIQRGLGVFLGKGCFGFD